MNGSRPARIQDQDLSISVQDEMSQPNHQSRLSPNYSSDLESYASSTIPRITPFTNLNKAFIILFIIVAATAFIFISNQASQRPPMVTPVLSQVTLQAQKQRVFPQIIWIQSPGRFDTLGMADAIVAQHQIQIGQKSGFQVRIVDDNTAYDWLSPEITQKIRKTKHSSQYFIRIHELLRLALLIQHGGIIVRAGKQILVDNLSWIEQTANFDYQTLLKLEKQQVLEACRMKTQPEAILFYQGLEKFKYYDDAVMIAKKQSKLFKELFEEIIHILILGKRPYDPLKFFGWFNNDGAISMQNFFSNLLNFRSHYWITGKAMCKDYNVISINKRFGSYLREDYNWLKIRKDLLEDKQQYFLENGKTHIAIPDFEAISKQFISLVEKQDIQSSHKNSFFREIIQAEGNKWLMAPANQNRDVQFCIISLKPLSKDNYQEKISRSIESLKKQDFKKWKAVYFVKNFGQKVIVLSREPLIKVSNASQWQGLNLQRAATQYCEQKDIGVILDYDQTFEAKESLSLLSNNFIKRDVFGAFVSTKAHKKVTQPKPAMTFQRKLMETNTNNLRELAEHFRAFSLYGYRLIPLFDLHDVEGRYYNREMPFYTLVQMATETCPGTEARFYLKKIQQRLQIPKRKAYIQDIVITMPAQKTHNFTAPEYKSKQTVHDYCYGIWYQLTELKKNLDDYFTLNNGEQYQGYKNRKHLPQLIPKKIHQIWIGEKELAPYKKILMDNIKRLHPSYQYYLWGNSNITRQNFPRTYDIIQLLFEFSKVSTKNKMAMVADLMRLEIIYSYGGFYIDTNYHIFGNHTLDDWLTYKAVMPAQHIPVYKFARDNGFFGCSKGFKNIQRLLDHRLLSQRNFFGWQANVITGPFYFSLAMQGVEDNDQDILLLPHDYIYPFYVENNYCVVSKETPAQRLLFKQKYAYGINCSEIYYWAFGIDFMGEGGSWMSS